MILSPYRFGTQPGLAATWANVKLRITADVAGNIVDVSSAARTINNANIGTQNTVVKFGAGAIRLPGNLYFYTDTHADFNYNSGDFTNEFWVRLDAATGADQYLMQAWASNNERFVLVAHNTGKLYFEVTSGGVSDGTLSASQVFSSNVWHKVMHQRSGTTTTVAIDGVVAYQGTPSRVYTNNNCRVEFGAFANTGQYWLTGYLDDIRITRGQALYTSFPYTPETSPLPTS